jgi:hypothetical protein
MKNIPTPLFVCTSSSLHQMLSLEKNYEMEGNWKLTFRVEEVQKHILSETRGKCGVRRERLMRRMLYLISNRDSWIDMELMVSSVRYLTVYCMCLSWGTNPNGNVAPRRVLSHVLFHFQYYPTRSEPGSGDLPRIFRVITRLAMKMLW